MKQILASLSAVSLVAGLSGHSSGAAPAASKKMPPTAGPTKAQRHAADLKKSAPADEYFGKLKMSYLGINNTLRDEAIRSGDYTTSDNIIHAVALAEDALRDWRQKYPNDPQLPRTLFLMGKMYSKIWTNYGQGQAAYYLLELQNHYAGNYFGKLVKKQLAKGFTEHILAEALPCPTPLATDTPPPTGERNRAKPTPSPTPTDTPTPAPTPQPMATPTVPPNSNIHIQVISVPCYTPVPSPTPTPSPIPSGALVPTPSPTGSASGSPRPSGSPAPAGTPAATATGSPAASTSPMPTPRKTPTHKR